MSKERKPTRKTRLIREVIHEVVGDDPVRVLQQEKFFLTTGRSAARLQRGDKPGRTARDFLLASQVAAKIAAQLDALESGPAVLMVSRSEATSFCWMTKDLARRRMLEQSHRPASKEERAAFEQSAAAKGGA
jgi:hypothetical protein